MLDDASSTSTTLALGSAPAEVLPGSAANVVLAQSNNEHTSQ